VSYADPERDYQAGRQHLSDLAGSRVLHLNGPVAATAPQALAIAETAAARAAAETEELEILLSWDWLGVSPGALLAVEGIRGIWAVVQTEIGRGTISLRCYREHGRRGGGRVTDGGRALVVPAKPAPATLFETIEVPFSSQSDAVGLIQVLPLAQDGWRGAEFTWSEAADDESSLGWLDQGIPHGALLTPLPSGPATMWDESRTLHVSGFWGPEGPLSREPRDILRGRNLLAVGDELLQFRNAAELGDGSYRLSGLLRGRKGTLPRSHAVGTRWFVFDEERSLSIPLQGDRVGSALRVEALGPGDVAEAAVRNHHVSGAGLSVLAPCHVRLVRGLTGITLRWVERTRQALDWYAPDSEMVGWYRVELRWTAAAQPFVLAQRIRALELAIPSAMLPALMAADPGSVVCTIESDGLGPADLRTTGPLFLQRIQ
jgi:hypothetical protein